MLIYSKHEYNKFSTILLKFKCKYSKINVLYLYVFIVQINY